MRVSVGFDLGFADDELDNTAEFMWEIGDLPLPRRGDRIHLGELVAIVAQVRYQCADAGSLAASGNPAVMGDLWLRLSRATRESRYSPADFHAILSELPSVTGLFVAGFDPQAGHPATEPAHDQPDQPRAGQVGADDTERVAVLGHITPDLLERHVGRHVQGLNLTGGGVAGRLERIDGQHAVITNGWGTSRYLISALRWLVHPGPFNLDRTSASPSGDSDAAPGDH